MQNVYQQHTWISSSLTCKPNLLGSYTIKMQRTWKAITGSGTVGFKSIALVSLIFRRTFTCPFVYSRSIRKFICHQILNLRNKTFYLWMLLLRSNAMTRSLQIHNCLKYWNKSNAICRFYTTKLLNIREIKCILWLAHKSPSLCRIWAILSFRSLQSR